MHFFHKRVDLLRRRASAYLRMDFDLLTFDPETHRAVLVFQTSRDNGQEW